MKIVQIAISNMGEDECIYAVGDDGEVYQYQHMHAPYTRYTNSYYDGHTGGWIPLNKGNKLDEIVPHPSKDCK